MKNHLESHAIRRVMVGTDRSETADQAVHWAAGFADRYDAELFVIQVRSEERRVGKECRL